MSKPDPTWVTVEKAAPLLIVKFNRPKQGNSLRLEMYSMVTRALEAAVKDDEIQAVVITGNGRFFSTGADVSEGAERMMQGEGMDELPKHIAKHPAPLTAAMIHFPKLLVAAVNGPVIGYPAAQLPLYDMVLVHPSATMQVPLLHVGLAQEGLSSYTLIRTIGRARANDMLITGRTLNAQEMVQFGVASRLIEAESTDAFVKKACEVVAQGCQDCAVSSMLASKKLQRASETETMVKLHKLETEALMEQFLSGEPLERFAAKLSKMKSKM